MPMIMAEMPPTAAHTPTSTGFIPCLATMVAPPEAMTMKKPPGGGSRSAFWTKATTTAMAVVYRAMRSIHQSLPPASICGHTTEPTKAPAIWPTARQRAA